MQIFNEGTIYLENISHDKNIVTGQNPWSTWVLAETMIKQLGYTPKYREITGEENAIKVLTAYEDHGLQKAKDMIESMSVDQRIPVDRVLLAQHSIVAIMQGRMGRVTDMLSLTKYAKSFDSPVISLYFGV